MIFHPMEYERYIEEVDPKTIFQLADDAYEIAQSRQSPTHYDTYKNYRLNFGNVRYQVLKRQRACQCCGIIGNRMFLCEVPEHDGGGFSFHLFAEAKDHRDGKVRLIQMTQDHIIPRAQGGTDDLENLRTLCLFCNNLRNLFGEVSIDRIRSALFLGYRVYRNSTSIRLSADELNKHKSRLAALRRAVVAITEGMKRVVKRDVSELVEKRNKKQEEADKLEQWIFETELNAQVTATPYIGATS
jgi:5-methylcytosine-specific restriction endonuclease McrA